MLVKTRQYLEQLSSDETIESYGAVGRKAFGKTGQAIVDFFLVLTQWGFCCGYLIFLWQNLASLIKESLHPLPNYACVLIFVGLVSPPSLLKNVKKLAPLSFLADVIWFVGFGFVLSFLDYKNFPVHWQEIDRGLRWQTLPIFFGIAVSSFEGIGLVLPMETSMKVHRGRYIFQLRLVISLVAVLLGGFGSMAYLTFGEHTQQMITLNFPSHSILSIIVKVGLMLAIWLTFPLQIYPVFEVTERVLLSRVRTPLVLLLFWRLCIIGTCATVAYFLPFFALISGLIGALGSTALAFILPAVFHFKIFYPSLSFFVKAKDVLIILFGLVMMVTGTYLSVLDIIHAHRK
jgi:solute carrier family 36 (proton-coupled amino acid transporter)